MIVLTLSILLNKEIKLRNMYIFYKSYKIIIVTTVNFAIIYFKHK